MLIFFWGVFALVSAVADDPQWILMPCVATLAYGYAFNMGFMNYYVSLGLGAFALALVWPVTKWEGKEADCIVAALFLIVAWLAHPLGCLWATATIAYLALRNRLKGWQKLTVPGGAIAMLLAFRWYLHHRPELAADWNSGLPFWQSNGADQLMVYGDNYQTLAWVALAFGVICLFIEVVRNLRNAWWWQDLALPVELYLLAFFAVATFPENFRLSMYAAWIGLLVSRLTAVCAIFGLVVLGRAQLRQWTIAGFIAIATAYFVFLGIDTRALADLEASAEARFSPPSPPRPASFPLSAPIPTGASSSSPTSPTAPASATASSTPTTSRAPDNSASASPKAPPSSSPTPPKTPTTCKAAATKSTAKTSPSNSSTNATAPTGPNSASTTSNPATAPAPSATPATNSAFGCPTLGL